MEEIKARRVQSPSSINVFKHCQRKYYYQYIKKLKTLPTIHTIRGVIAHKVLEDFFEMDALEYSFEDLRMRLTSVIQNLLFKEWQNADFSAVNLAHDQMVFYFEETMMMLMNWLNNFVESMENYKELGVERAFEILTPKRELEYVSDRWKVRGFIDAIHEIDEKVHLLDYKTSARFNISDAYKLQLAIYALLYFEKHGVKPDKVGIFFLRDKKKFINVDDELMNLAKTEIRLTHENTLSDNMDDYSMNVTPLCRWSTGQCDFYPLCFGQKKLEEF